MIPKMFFSEDGFSMEFPWFFHIFPTFFGALSYGQNLAIPPCSAILTWSAWVVWIGLGAAVSDARKK